MTLSNYSYEKRTFNTYEAYFLMVSTTGLLSKKKNRFVPTLSNFIVDKKNKMTKVNRFPQVIDEQNFFHFIHAEDSSRLEEFIHTYPDIKLYISEISKYIKSIEDEKKYMMYADLIVPKNR